jgi:hypothetical protein
VNFTDGQDAILNAAGRARLIADLRTVALTNKSKRTATACVAARRDELLGVQEA